MERNVRPRLQDRHKQTTTIAPSFHLMPTSGCPHTTSSGDYHDHQQQLQQQHQFFRRQQQQPEFCVRLLNAEDALLIENTKTRLQSKLAAIDQNVKSIRSLDKEINVSFHQRREDVETLLATKTWYEEHNQKLLQQAQQDSSLIDKLETKQNSNIVVGGGSSSSGTNFSKWSLPFVNATTTIGGTVTTAAPSNTTTMMHCITASPTKRRLSSI